MYGCASASSGRPQSTGKYPPAAHGKTFPFQQRAGGRRGRQDSGCYFVPLLMIFNDFFLLDDWFHA